MEWYVTFSNSPPYGREVAMKKMQKVDKIVGRNEKELEMTGELMNVLAKAVIKAKDATEKKKEQEQKNANDGDSGSNKESQIVSSSSLRGLKQYR